MRKTLYAVLELSPSYINKEKEECGKQYVEYAIVDGRGGMR